MPSLHNPTPFGFPASQKSPHDNTVEDKDDDLVVPAEVFLKWCLLPSLEWLKIDARVAPVYNQEDLTLLRIQAVSNNVNLEVCKPNMRNEALRSFLPKARHLSTLELGIPGQVMTPPEIPCNKYLCYHRLDSAIFTELFMPVSDIFKELSLNSVQSRGFQIAALDNTSIDISSFRQLKNIDISHYLLPSTTKENPNAKFELAVDLWECLPRSLYVLIIHLHPPRGLF